MCPDRHGPLSGNSSNSLYMPDLNGLVCLVFILFVIVGKSLLKGGALIRGEALFRGNTVVPSTLLELVNFCLNFTFTPVSGKTCFKRK